jgi:hypothetical protein
MPLTQARLKELLHYDPETGLFYWLVSRGNKLVKVGDVAGYRMKNGYRCISVGGVRDYAHRWAFLYMTGKMPPGHVDHADGDQGNDSWANLRAATVSQNIGNAKMPCNNPSGFKGVHPFRNKWRARLVNRHLGVFDDPVEAAKAYDRAAASYYGEFARHNGLGA